MIADLSTVGTSGATVKQDNGPDVYGSDLHAMNDTTHLAKMRSADLLAEYERRVSALASSMRPGVDVATIPPLAQQVNRARRAIVEAIDTGRLVAVDDSVAADAVEFWHAVRSLATETRRLDAGSYRAGVVLHVVDALGLGR